MKWEKDNGETKTIETDAERASGHVGMGMKTLIGEKSNVRK